jgi:formylglycine-generating enzyme required for sulfatase activity
VTTVGAYTGSASPYGTFDQGGNVWEWNEQAIYDGLFRVIRGGDWGTSASSLAASNPSYNDPPYESFVIGFRVASLPEPETSLPAIVALAGIAAGRRRLWWNT